MLQYIDIYLLTYIELFNVCRYLILKKSQTVKKTAVRTENCTYFEQQLHLTTHVISLRNRTNEAKHIFTLMLTILQ